jgi:formylglycine-generating enzyme required for sulfatase activity
MGTTPWKGQSNVQEGSDVAATYVSWEDAVAFCDRISNEDGRRYRLPAEAEWEWCCRAGTTTAYSFGDDVKQLGKHAWWGGVLGNGNCESEQYAHCVGQKQANPFGLYDMHGNVWEWCSDWYGEKYDASSPGSDPTGPLSGSFRVLRGGSWSDAPDVVRCANRNCNTPGRRRNFIGFRVVLE